MTTRLILAFALGMVACSNAPPASIDRTDFDLLTCPDGATSSFDGLTPSTPVDYLELRTSFGSTLIRGERCGGATDLAACEQAYAEHFPPGDAWSSGPGGGAPAPTAYLVFTRGDEVGAVGASALAAFLAPIESPFDAAFLAHVATLGGTDCTEPSARVVTGGHEVITRVEYPCGGAIEEFRVLVDESGATTVLERVVVEEGVEMLCP